MTIAVDMGRKATKTKQNKLLVNRLLKPAQEKVWLSELTVPQ